MGAQCNVCGDDLYYDGLCPACRIVELENALTDLRNETRIIKAGEKITKAEAQADRVLGIEVCVYDAH